MADREVAGRCTCPICGEPLQDIRVNVNQKLYCYCDNGCSFKFNSAQSRKFLPELRAGRNVATSQGITIFSMSERKESKDNEEKQVTRNIQPAGRTGGITGGIATRNTTGGITGINGRVETGRRDSDAGRIEQHAGKRGFIAAWLGDDDDDD